ncbi:protein brambleberry-like [Notechis scutatus]|uniref:Protein brambleberry-like n=1 Tax=Notechis scutatus TaxID=8663 RepID=A0A6J1VKM3_9SAUR|nr:protein brambleberry-like [Notechis scutatus]
MRSQWDISSVNPRLRKMLPVHSWALIFPLPLLLVVAPSSGFFGWLTQKASPTPAPNPEPAAAALDPAGLAKVPFEMDTADERFLAEAQAVDRSLLDSCHHKVISQLRSTCTDLTEEELAKLGVALFNCQASAEGRRIYLCTQDMALAECTSGMDPDTWNAYHIVSNRARAVCYATRQMQFKRRAEHTVNTLVSTAVGQLEAMKTLKRSQEELKLLTSESLQRVVSAQEELLTRQETLRDGQAQMEDSLSSNLEHLVQEKALIASGQQQVADLLEGITRRMENVSSHLNQQDVELQEGHQSILRDLGQVQKRAQDVYSKIDTNAGLFLAYQKQTALYHDELLEKLRKMNETFGLVLQTMEKMETKVEGRLQHIQRFITWAGFSLSAVCTCLLHLVYFLLAALLMTFLQVPGASRAFLLVVVVANALSELHHTVSLGFKSLTSLLALSVAVNLLLERICRHALKDRQRRPLRALPHKAPETPACKGGLKPAKRCRVTSTPDREDEVGLLDELEKLEEVSYLSDGFPLKKDDLPKDGHLLTSTQGSGQETRAPGLSSPGSALRRLNLSRGNKPEATLEKLSRPHLGSVFSSFTNPQVSLVNDSLLSDVSSCSASPRPFCQGVTRSGHPCRKKALTDHLFCHLHVAGQSHLA